VLANLALASQGLADKRNKVNELDFLTAIAMRSPTAMRGADQVHLYPALTRQPTGTDVNDESGLLGFFG